MFRTLRLLRAWNAGAAGRPSAAANQDASDEESFGDPQIGEVDH